MRYACAYWHNETSLRDRTDIWGAYAPGDELALAYDSDSVEAATAPEAAELLWMRHNHDDRPTGHYCPSMSIGDVAEVWVATDGFRQSKSFWLAAASVGFVEIEAPVEDKLDWRRYANQRASDAELARDLDRLVAERDRQMAAPLPTAPIRERLHLRLRELTQRQIEAITAELEVRRAHRDASAAYR